MYHNGGTSLDFVVTVCQGPATRWPRRNITNCRASVIAESECCLTMCLISSKRASRSIPSFQLPALYAKGSDFTELSSPGGGVHVRRFVANSATASNVAASRACKPDSGLRLVVAAAVLQHDAADVVHLLGIRPSIRIYGSGMAASSNRNWPLKIKQRPTATIRLNADTPYAKHHYHYHARKGYVMPCSADMHRLCSSAKSQQKRRAGLEMQMSSFRSRTLTTLRCMFSTGVKAVRPVYQTKIRAFRMLVTTAGSAKFRRAWPAACFCAWREFDISILLSMTASAMKRPRADPSAGRRALLYPPRMQPATSVSGTMST